MLRDLRLALPLLLALAPGCNSSGEPKTPPAEPEPVATPEPEAQEPAPQELEGMPSQDEIQKLFEAAMERLNKAAEAGSAAEEGAKSDCERAHRGMNGMVEYLRANTEEGEGPIPEPPAEKVFLDLCKSLSPEMQRCMVISHAMKNQEECQRVQEGLSPEEIARIEAALNGASAED